MPEYKMIILLTLGPFLWCVGGTWWKPARRFVWPVLAGLMLFGSASWWQALGFVAALVLANVLPYGDRTPWRIKVIVFFALGAHVIDLDPIFGLFWALGTAITLATLMLLSRTYSRVTHKVWEASAGFLQAAGIVLGVLR